MGSFLGSRVSALFLSGVCRSDEPKVKSCSEAVSSTFAEGESSDSKGLMSASEAKEWCNDRRAETAEPLTRFEDSKMLRGGSVVERSSEGRGAM